ncbi:endo-1,4-beta-xylanase [Fischerella thermalis]|uniref:Beta-xylanase n=1 Tax=Fischerella thermalis CCMEE 5318 TaxID=2019666 RepID=A0A2N6LLY6_9CYAN|nr:endo-1,4-beta-xylanase [Fischerella thermalis]PMB26159.1 glycosyl hydrolase family 10 [Fischerella thermalis CCMEE 5318]
MPNRRLVTRRQALWLSLGTLTSIGAIATAKAGYESHQIQSLDNSKRNFKLTTYTPLKKRASAKGIIYGAATRRDLLESNPKLASSFVQQCGILVPEWELKWNFLRPTPNRFDFTAGDWLAKFARTHGILFRGHTLVWHEALPEWFEEVVNRQNAEKFLVEHITTVTKHYAGQIHSWDVVNEATKIDHKRSDGLRNSPWLEFLGPNYIELAFRIAAEQDPKAMLVYNDTGLEYDTPEDEAKRGAILKLLERLKSRGTPIHGFGIQSHLYGHETRFNPKKLRKFLADVASLNLKILVTELDVRDQNLPKDLKIRDRIVAAAYEDYLSAVLDEKAVIAVLNWGLSDSHTWLAQYAPRSDGLAIRALPFDSNLKPKLAWNAIARAFDQASKR